MAEYSRPFTIAYLGAALAEAESVEVNGSSNDKPVRTLRKGLAGFSNGAEEVGLTIRNAIPLTGYERDFEDLCQLHRTVQFTVQKANVIDTYEGRILSTAASSSVDAPNALNVTFSGKRIAHLTL